MGIFDFLFSGGEDSQLKKHCKRLQNLNAPQEERVASAQWLADNKSVEAIEGLLRRFAIHYEKQMKDVEEKEHIYGLLRKIGIDVVAPTKEWLRKNSNFAYPIKLIEEFDGAENTVGFLLELLGLEMDPFKPEKKKQLIIKLGDYTDSRIVSPVVACLLDYDEEVRLMAVETLYKQNTDDCQVAMLDALSNPEEESNRLRIRIAEIAQKRNWDISAHAEKLTRNPPVGWQVVNGALLPM